MTAPPSPWLTVKEAAQYARYSPNRIYAALGSGTLAGVQGPGYRGKWLTTSTDLDNWIRGGNANGKIQLEAQRSSTHQPSL